MNVDYHTYTTSIMFVGCIIKTILFSFYHYDCL